MYRTWHLVLVLLLQHAPSPREIPIMWRHIAALEKLGHIRQIHGGGWRHMCFGQRFVWLTDCYALKFILSYDGKNPAILQLQMRFMCWDMIIEHRNDVCLTDADYFSHLGADLCYDPLLKEYIQQVHALQRQSPAPTMLPIPPEHQPQGTPYHYTNACASAAPVHSAGSGSVSLFTDCLQRFATPCKLAGRDRHLGDFISPVS
jgi:hypothetical protein